MRFKVNSARCFDGFGPKAIKTYKSLDELYEVFDIANQSEKQTKLAEHYRELLEKYNYEPDDHITINTLEELIKLLKRVKCGLVLDTYSNDKEITITIYDGYLE